MAETQPQPAQMPTIDRIPNGLLVFIIVAFLLKGPAGALNAFWQYTKSLLVSLVGGEDLLIEVLCQTFPLTLSGAMIAFAFRGGWLSYRSTTSVAFCSAVIVAATWFGGLARQSIVTREVASPLFVGESSVTVVSLRELSVARDDFQENLNDECITVGEALKEISDNNAIDENRIADRQAVVPRVRLLPESGGIPGTIGRALNQLVGYCVFYGPRLFLAAMVLGIYIGCSFHSLWSSYSRYRPIARASSASSSQASQRPDGEYCDRRR